MGDPAIRVEGMGKAYTLLGGGGGSRASVPLWRRPLLPFFPQLDPNRKRETFWALKDVSFTIHQGEVVGVIGANGAGKSTLLKLLSCISDPTEGFAELHGRVAALLEVGTGFHPELSGRENIYLGGAIRGMLKEEIDRKFDEIVAFAEVGQFLDLPIKHYSSGMQTRLGFAVAAHLEPEILLVDEVLAVGDIGFQKKCIAKMNTIGQGGRTVLVVSHNMATITRLCQRVILLERGRLIHDGRPEEGVRQYLAAGTGLTSCRIWRLEEAPGDEQVRLLGVRMVTGGGVCQEAFDIRHDLFIEIDYWLGRDMAHFNATYRLTTEDGVIAFISGTMHEPNWDKRILSPGVYRSRCRIPGNFMAEGMYFVTVVLNTMRIEIRPIHHVRLKEIAAFQMVDALEGDSARRFHRGAYYGVIRPILEWQTERMDPIQLDSI